MKNSELLDPSIFDTIEDLSMLLEALKEELLDDESVIQLEHIESTIQNLQFRIAVVANMSSGKSSILNALFGESILPALNEATTDCAIYIYSDDDPKNNGAIIHFSNGGLKKLSEKDVKNSLWKYAIKDTIDLNQQFHDVSKIDLYWDFENIKCQQNMQIPFVFIDTPGPNNSGEFQQKHWSTTHHIISQIAHLALFIFDYGQLDANLSSDEQGLWEILKKRKSEDPLFDVFFIINKIDLSLADDEQMDVEPGTFKRKAFEKLKTTATQHGFNSPKIFSISAKLGFLGRQTNFFLSWGNCTESKLYKELKKNLLFFEDEEYPEEALISFSGINDLEESINEYTENVIENTLIKRIQNQISCLISDLKNRMNLLMFVNFSISNISKPSIKELTLKREILPMLFCPNCRTEYDKGKFCPECGVILETKTNDGICNQCHAEIDENSKFCMECGARINDESNKTKPKEELEYTEFLEDCLADGRFTEDERRMIEKLRIKLSISEVKAYEIEQNVKKRLAPYSDEELDKMPIDQLNELAEAGSPNATFKFACRLASAKDRENNYEKAFELFTTITNNGHAGAHTELGKMYLYGLHVNKDEEKSFIFFQKAKDLGDNHALEYLGNCYYDQIGVQENYEKALYYFQKSIENGVASDTTYFNLGDMFQYEIGANLDYNKAYDFYLKAYEKGHMGACYEIGLMHYYGRGVEEDNEKAFDFLKEASESGVDKAYAELGDMFENGYLVKKDCLKAEEYYKKAVKADYLKAYRYLALLHFSGCENEKEGSVIEQNLEKAADLFLKAARKEDYESMIWVAIFYFFGEGVERDYNETLKWLRKSNETIRSLEAVTTDFLEIVASILCDDIDFYEGNNIDKHKLNNALNQYLEKMEERNEVPLLFYDNTFWGSAKEGCTFTEKAFYFNSGTPGWYAYDNKALANIGLESGDLVIDDLAMVKANDENGDTLFNLLNIIHSLWS